MRALPICIAAAALAACARSEPVEQSPEELEEVAEIAREPLTPVNETSPAPTDPLTPGQWFTRDEGGNPWAGYGPPQSEAAFSARCENGTLIFNTTEVPQDGPGPATLQVTAEGVDESLPAEVSENGLPNTQARVDAGAPWLSELQTASGNMSVRIGDGPPITVPISEPLTSLIRDCRR